MSVHWQRAQVLVQQGRLEAGLEELRNHLGAEPNDPWAQAMMALCLNDLGRFDDAEAAAAKAIGNGPEVAFTHYVLGVVLSNRGRYEDAERLAAEALRLDPSDESHWWLKARLALLRERFEDALAAIDSGLAMAPEDTRCLNLRAEILRRLGRGDEAASAIELALRTDPENADTHRNAGYERLRCGDGRGAFGHFREALRIDPTDDAAREGVVASLKATNRVYAFLLRGILWWSDRSSKFQWAVLLGGWFLYRVLVTVRKHYPEQSVWLTPLIVAYLVCALVSWIGDPLSNLLLRLHPTGRLALSREQVVASNLLGLALLAAVVLGVLCGVTGSDLALIGAIVCLLACIGIAGAFSCPAGGRRRIAAGLVSLNVLLGLGVLLTTWMAERYDGRTPVTPKPSLGERALLLGWILSSVALPWVLNILLALRRRR